MIAYCLDPLYRTQDLLSHDQKVAVFIYRLADPADRTSVCLGYDADLRNKYPYDDRSYADLKDRRDQRDMHLTDTSCESLDGVDYTCQYEDPRLDREVRDTHGDHLCRSVGSQEHHERTLEEHY